jgi:hypothetical protein
MTMKFLLEKQMTMSWYRHLRIFVLRPSKGHRDIQGKALRNLISEFRDIWRVRLSTDGPAKVTPLKVHLKPDAARRYAPKTLAFHEKADQVA